VRDSGRKSSPYQFRHGRGHRHSHGVSVRHQLGDVFEAFGLTISNAAAAAYGLRVGLAWWFPGIALAIGYSFFMHRRFAGKVRSAGEGY
jgi:hypothetical protein